MLRYSLAMPRPSLPTPSTTDETDAIVDTLLTWFASEGTPWPWRQTRDRWRILVSEVCLQQTQVGRAAAHIERILERFPTAADLAGAPLSELLDLWQGLGYPRRARNLWNAARVIAGDGWPADFTDLPGVGPYTAAALSCFADEEPVLPADINTRRVVARLFPTGAPVVADEAWAWGQAVMELGQRACRARARCGECPVAALCPSAGTTEVIASPRQARYEGSMRQRRGVMLRALTESGRTSIADDVEAARTLLEDGLATSDGEYLIPQNSLK